VFISVPFFKIKNGRQNLKILEEKKLEREIGPMVCVVAGDTVFKGNLIGKDTICVRGLVEGDIQTERLLWVDANGRVKGNIRARRVINEGEIVGDIHATEQVDVRSQGRVIGNINAARVSISQGCFFEGEARILR
jgi:cytoskeletal protein CcmA (bactofilin family)